MTRSAFPFLDGRTAFDGPIARAPRSCPNGVGEILRHLRRRMGRPRAHEGR